MVINKLADFLNAESRKVATKSDNNVKFMMYSIQGKGKSRGSKRIALLSKPPDLGPIPFAGIRA